MQRGAWFFVVSQASRNSFDWAEYERMIERLVAAVRRVKDIPDAEPSLASWWCVYLVSVLRRACVWCN